MTDTIRYCPFCKTLKPMVKAGKAWRPDKDKQRWLCVNKRCRKTTVNPLKEK